jgi:phage terminase Nu1 subunit (DNA packaging protein)
LGISVPQKSKSVYMTNTRRDDMEKNAKITAETEVSTTELACILGISGRRIRQMAEDGQLEKLGAGKFNLCDSVQAYQKFLAKVMPSAEDVKAEKARRKAEVMLKSSKAEIARLEVAELKGQMHSSEDVRSMTEDLIYTIRGALLAMPGRMAVDVVGVKTAAEASEIIRAEVYKVMEELSQYEYDPAKYDERVRQRRAWAEKDTDDD